MNDDDPLTPKLRELVTPGVTDSRNFEGVGARQQSRQERET